VQPFTLRAEEATDKTDPKSVFQAYVSDGNNWNLSHFLYGVSIFTTLVGSQKIQLNASEFQPILTDFFRIGICFAKDMEDIVSEHEEQLVKNDTFTLSMLFIGKGRQNDTPVEVSCQ